MDKRLQLGEQSRETILDVATRLMSARGYDGASISAISKESGLPASSIYWHFSSKVGVLRAVMDRGNARFHLEAASAEMPEDGSSFDKVLTVLEQGMATLQADPDFFRLQVVLMLNSPAGHVDEAVLRIRQQARDGMRVVLARAFADLGAPRAHDVAAGLVAFVAASFEGIFLAQESGASETLALLRQLARSTVALAESMVAPPAEHVTNP